jgi:hypothetical protein
MRAYQPVLGCLLVLALALAIVALPGLAACTTQAPPAPTPTSVTFADLFPFSVALLSADDGWVVGRGTSTPPAQMLHLQQGHWTRVPLDVSSESFSKVVLLSPTDGWAVGEHFYHFDGTRWTRASSAQLGGHDDLIAIDVAFLSHLEGWATGSIGSRTGLLHYHNGQWTDVTASLPQFPPPFPGTAYNGPGLLALAFASATEAWAVG